MKRSIQHIAILSPGDMGHAVGSALGKAGFEVITCLENRSDRTKGLAQKSNIRDLKTLEDLVQTADLILSILVPSEAVKVAKQISGALRTTGANIVFADCNAISPHTTSIIHDIITDSKSQFIDASIIGGPPSQTSTPRFYVSGSESHFMEELNSPGIEIRHLGEKIGMASGMKMCYAAFTKGSSALSIALLIVAQSLGVLEPLKLEFNFSQTQNFQQVQSQIPSIPSKAFRWIGEMNEIADTFEKAGITPNFHKGSATIFSMIDDVFGTTEIAKDASDLTFEEIISALHTHLDIG